MEFLLSKSKLILPGTEIFPPKSKCSVLSPCLFTLKLSQPFPWPYYGSLRTTPKTVSLAQPSFLSSNHTHPTP